MYKYLICFSLWTFVYVKSWWILHIPKHPLLYFLRKYSFSNYLGISLQAIPKMIFPEKSLSVLLFCTLLQSPSNIFLCAMLTLILRRYSPTVSVVYQDNLDYRQHKFIFLSFLLDLVALNISFQNNGCNYLWATYSCKVNSVRDYCRMDWNSLAFFSKLKP